MIAWCWRWDELTAKGFQGQFWGEGNILPPACGGRHMDDYNCQNSPSSTLKIVVFILYKLCFNRMGFVKCFSG